MCIWNRYVSRPLPTILWAICGAILALGVVSFGVATASPVGETIEFEAPVPTKEFNGFWSDGEVRKHDKIVGYLALPESGSAPHPTVVISHTAGGISDVRELYYADQLNKAGFATFVVDHYGPRGIESTVGRYANRQLPVNQQAMDLFAALKVLSGKSEIGPIAVAGASAGGTAALWASYSGPAATWGEGAQFTAHIILYPSCVAQQDEIDVTGAPMLFLLAGVDGIGPTPACEEIASRVSEAGVYTETVVFEDSFHAWESGPKVTKTAKLGVLDFSRCKFRHMSDGSVKDLATGKIARDSKELLPFFKCAKRGGKNGGKNVRAEAAEKMISFLNDYMK